MKTGRSLTPPLSIRQFIDGEAYDLPDLETFETKFSRVGCRDDVVIKTPSNLGLSDYRKFVKSERFTSDDIRCNEELERFSNIHKLVEKYPQFRMTSELCGKETTHFLLVHRLQYERLQGCGLGIPESRFVVASRRSLFRTNWIPAIVQASVQGWSLYSMFDHTHQVLRSEWRPYLPAISNVLTRVLHSALRDHINWNIKNLIFDKSAGKLHYVDLKPSTMFGRSANEHNIRGIREVFLI